MGGPAWTRRIRTGVSAAGRGCPGKRFEPEPDRDRGVRAPDEQFDLGRGPRKRAPPGEGDWSAEGFRRQRLADRFPGSIASHGAPAPARAQIDRPDSPRDRCLARTMNQTLAELISPDASKDGPSLGRGSWCLVRARSRHRQWFDAKAVSICGPGTRDHRTDHGPSTKHQGLTAF